MKRRILASLLSLVMMLSLLPTAVWAVNDEGSTSSGNGWPAGATGITVATEQYSAKDYEEDTTNVTHSDTIWYKIDGDTLTIGGKGVVSSIFRKKVCGVWQEQSQPATEVSSGATSR